MAVGARKVFWTEAEYLAMEDQSPIKHEYYQGEIFAMAGARPAHNALNARLTSVLGRLASGKGCEGLTSDQRIRIPSTGLYTYADGGLACGKWEIHADGMALLNPFLLFEVLSPATRDYDLGAKRDHYFEIPSLRHVIIADQPGPRVWHSRRETAGRWTTIELATGIVDLGELGSFEVAELYPPDSIITG